MTVNVCCKKGKNNLDCLFSLTQQSVLSQISSVLDKRGDKLAKELFAGEAHVNYICLSLISLRYRYKPTVTLKGGVLLLFFHKNPASLAGTLAPSIAVKAMKANNFHPKNKCQGIKTKIKSQAV